MKYLPANHTPTLENAERIDRVARAIRESLTGYTDEYENECSTNRLKYERMAEAAIDASGFWLENSRVKAALEALADYSISPEEAARRDIGASLRKFEDKVRRAIEEVWCDG